MVDQIDVDRLGAQSGRLEQWRGVGANDTFHLRIADQPNRLRLGQARIHRTQDQEQGGRAGGNQGGFEFAQRSDPVLLV